MRPSHPTHAVTSLYREPGGLHALDFYMERVMQYTDRVDASRFRMLVVADETAQYALPFAAMGFSVTNLHVSDAAVSSVQSIAMDLGVELACKVGRIQDEAAGFYDVVLVPGGLDQTGALDEWMQSASLVLKPNGLLLCHVSRGWEKDSKRYQVFARIIREHGFRILASHNASMGYRERYRARLQNWVKRGSPLFHSFDRFDRWLSERMPRTWASSWMFECRKAQAKTLVVHLVPTLVAGGGAERLAMQLSERLPSHGYETMMIANVRGGGLEPLLVQHGITYAIYARQGFGGRWTSFWQLHQALADLQPDVVHTHLFAADFWGRLAARFAGIRNVVTTIHNVHVRFGWLGVTIMRLMSGFSKTYIAISKEVEMFIQKTLRVPSNKISLIVNGIAVSQIHKRQNRPFRDVPRLLFVGRLEPQKNPDVLLRALAQVPQSWELTMVNTGSMETELRHLADQLGMAARIHWLGTLADISDLYAKHDVFCFPSQWEGFGLAAVEAAVAGIPMVVSDLPVMRELFQSTEVRFVSPGDDAALARAIEDLLQNPSLAIQQAQRLADRDWSTYSLERMIDEHDALYRSLLSSGRKS